MIEVAPTGKLVRGHVLDVAKAPLERKLKEYDVQLYLVWNPLKLKGRGVWELRRRNATKSIVDWAVFEGNCYTRLEYAEVDLVNHVLDIPHLNYSVLDKLQEMDTWNKGYGIESVVAQAERNMDYHEAKQAEKNRAEMLYQAKQYRRQFNDFREQVLSGLNPAEIARHWGK